VDGHDLRMPQPCGAAGLAEEPFDGRGRLDHPGSGPLQGHGAIQGGIPGPVDDPEGATAEHRAQLVAVDAGRRPRRVVGAVRAGRLRRGCGRRPPAQVRLGGGELGRDDRVDRQVAEPLQVRLDPHALAGLDPRFHLLVHQLEEDRRAVGASRGEIGLDRRFLPAPQGLAERSDGPLEPFPGDRVKFRRDPRIDVHRPLLRCQGVPASAPRSPSKCWS